MARLNREVIVEAALGLLDRVGLDELSTRRVADELEVKSPALYWHFASKRDLLDAMAETMFERAAMPDPPGPSDDLADWLSARQRAFRRGLLRYRDGARVHAGTRPDPAQLPSIEAQVQAMTNAGFGAEDALRAIQALSRYTVGWVLEEQAAADRADEGEFDLAAYPRLRSAHAILHRQDPDADFEFGLRALVAGVIDQLPEQPAT